MGLAIVVGQDERGIKCQTWIGSGKGGQPHLVIVRPEELTLVVTASGEWGLSKDRLGTLEHDHLKDEVHQFRTERNYVISESTASHDLVEDPLLVTIFVKQAMNAVQASSYISWENVVPIEGITVFVV